MNNTGSSGGDGNYNHVGDPSPGWPVSGGTYGAGGGGTATTQRIRGADDRASWDYTQSTYGPYAGYVKIVKS